MNSQRDRATGWKHAKLTGHENESILEELMSSDSELQEFFLDSIGKSGIGIKHVDVGGLHEKDVPCVFPGEKTKSKTDMHIILNDGSHYNVSIKKSLSGQVYLISANRFIRGFEMQYRCEIPSEIKRAIFLFWGYAEDTEEIVKRCGTQKTYELHKHRLVADTLYQYDSSLYNSLISWFKTNIALIADFCFSRGLALEQSEWANVIWYVNELGENSVNEIILTDDLCERVRFVADTDIIYGNKGGGTTIQLPFGFVQWHSPTKRIPGDMQFHHKYEKIHSLFGED